MNDWKEKGKIELEMGDIEVIKCCFIVYVIFMVESFEKVIKIELSSFEWRARGA